MGNYCAFRALLLVSLQRFAAFIANFMTLAIPLFNPIALKRYVDPKGHLGVHISRRRTSPVPQRGVGSGGEEHAHAQDVGAHGGAVKRRPT